MKDESKLPLPLQGVSENLSPAEQELGTTHDAKNVRGVDSETGEVRLSQRPGFDKFLTGYVNAEGTKVDHVAAVGYEVDLITYTQRTGTGTVTKDDSFLSGSKAETFSPRTDRNGDLYFLDGADTIVVLNSEMQEQATISLPLGESDTVCRQIVVDERDFLYAAGGTPETFKDGKVWRFSKDDDTERWKLDWEQPVTGSVIRLAYTGGVLYVGQRNKDGEKDTSHVTALNVIADAPIHMWTKAVPDPLGDLGVLPKTGDLLFTSPYNEDRTKSSADGNFGVTTVDGIVYDCLATEKSERVFAWGDAEALDGLSYGDPVTRVEDSRFLSTWATDPNYTSALPDDDTNRFMHRSITEGNKRWKARPLYDSAGFGSKPGIKFDSEVGRVLCARPNSQGENKGAGDAKLPFNKGIIPGVKDANWMMSFIVRLTVSDDPQVVFCTRGGKMKFAVVANAGDSFNPTTGGAVGAKPGFLQLYSPGGHFGGLAASANHVGEVDWTAGNDTNCALITIIHNGAGTCDWRVNGTSVSTFTWSEDELYNPNHDMVSAMFGGPQLRQGPLGSAGSKDYTTQIWDEETQSFKDVVYKSEPDGYGAQAADVFGDDFSPAIKFFDGWLAEYVVVLGDTSTNPHDNGFTVAETDDLESYLANKWGIQDLLGSPTAPTGLYGGGAFTSDAHQATVSKKAVAGKLSASSGALQWAFNKEGGVGLAIAGNDDGDVFTYGERDYELQLSPSSSALVSPVALKVIDEGKRVETGTQATGTLTFTGQPANGETVTIGANIYTFVDPAAPSTAFEVDIGAAATDSRDNLIKAISRDEDGRGTDYFDCPKHHQVTAAANGTLAIDITSIKAGDTENAIATTETVANATWDGGATTLSGGDAKKTWTLTGVRDGSSKYPREVGGSYREHSIGAGSAFEIAIDDEGDAYFTKNNVGGTDLGGIFKYPKGADDDTSGDVTLDWSYTTGAYPSVAGSAAEITKFTGIAFPPTHPDYGLQDVTCPIHCYITLEGPEGASGFTTYSDSTVQKLRLVTEARSGADSPRGQRLIAVSGGDVKGFSKDGTYTSIGSSQFVTSPYIGGFTVGAQHIMYDGTQARLYDARRNTLAKWVAKKGEVPGNGRIVLGEGWRARACVVPSDDPHKIVMSKVGDVFDFNLYPDVPNYKQAFDLTADNSIGKLPDQVQALYALDSERLLIGGDRSLHILIGDPASVALGDFGKSHLSRISNEIGIAFGQTSIAQDPEGTVYFFGSRGGVYVLSGNGVQSISMHRIERRLQDINLGTYKPLLAWDWRRDGLVLAFAHRTTGGVLNDRYFWERKTNAWWPEDSALATLQPSCVTVLDGDDPNDRVLVYGCEDGAIRYVSDAKVNDDGERILSYADLGPFEIGGPGSEGRLKAIEVALAEHNGVDVEVFVSDAPNIPKDYVTRVRLEPGFTIQRLRARGAYLWLRLRNGSKQERWAVDRLTARLAPAGRRRQRN